MFGAEEEPEPDEQKDTEPVSDDDGNAEPKAKKEVKEKFLNSGGTQYDIDCNVVADSLADIGAKLCETPKISKQKKP